MVVSAAAGTFLLQANRGASSLFRDGLRLVLTVFLFFSMLWSFLSFGATLVNPRDPGGCQTLVAVASASDQLARVVLEEFLFFSMKTDLRTNFGLFASQAIIVLRFVLGGVFIGVQRPQFNPVCVGTTLVLALGVAILATDGVIVLILLIRASSVGVFSVILARKPGWRQARQLIIITFTLAIWIMVCRRGYHVPWQAFGTDSKIVERPNARRYVVIWSRRTYGATGCWFGAHHW